VFLFFLAEFFLFNVVGRWFKPNLLLLLIIYFNLAFGIRYGILGGVVAGLLKDSFGVSVFGLHICAFVLCAYLTIILKRYFHYLGFYWTRILLVVFVTMFYVMVQFGIRLMFGMSDIVNVVCYVFIPELMITLIVAPVVLKYLRKCVLKLFV